MEADEVLAGIAMMRAGYAKPASAGIDALSRAQLLAAQDDLETLARQLPTQSHRMIARLTAESLAGGLRRQVVAGAAEVAVADLTLGGGAPVGRGQAVGSA